MYGYEHMGMGWGGLWMVLVWAIPIILIVLLIRSFFGGRNAGSGGSSLDILDARYARGEIDREEYVKRRADLKATDPKP